MELTWYKTQCKECFTVYTKSCDVSWVPSEAVNWLMWSTNMQVWIVVVMGNFSWNDSWLSRSTEKLLTGSRGHCSVVSNDGKILQRAETALKKEHFTLVKAELKVVGRHPYRDVNVASTNECLSLCTARGTGKFRLSVISITVVGNITGWQNKEISIVKRKVLLQLCLEAFHRRGLLVVTST